MTSPKREVRTVSFSVEERADGKLGKITGHAAVFDQETVIAGLFREKVAKGAFNDTIKVDDIRALFNHDSNHVLGRNKAGTLKLSEDEKGLAIEVEPPDTQFARDLMVSIERGDVDQMSFGFRVLHDEWERGEDEEKDLRTLRKVQLFDVSPVTFPAYEGTDVAVRSHDEWKAKTEEASKKCLRAKLVRRKFNYARSKYGALT